MAQQTAEKLRRELDGVAGRQGRCFPRDLKERTSDWIAEQRATGATATQIAAELGLASGTVLRWGKAGKRSARALVPLEVVADVAATGTLAVVSPSGFRVEGLSFASAVAFLRALGLFPARVARCVCLRSAQGLRWLVRLGSATRATPSTDREETSSRDRCSPAAGSQYLWFRGAGRMLVLAHYPREAVRAADRGGDTVAPGSGDSAGRCFCR